MIITSFEAQLSKKMWCSYYFLGFKLQVFSSCEQQILLTSYKRVPETKENTAFFFFFYFRKTLISNKLLFPLSKKTLRKIVKLNIKERLSCIQEKEESEEKKIICAPSVLFVSIYWFTVNECRPYKNS